MNDLNTPAGSPDDFQLRLDRLADGELNHVQQRQLLSTLDNQLDGWRRCALAFIEAQTWRSEMRRMSTGNTPSNLADREQTLAIAPRAVQQRRFSNRWRWFAMAASILLGFLLGLAVESQLSKSTLLQPDRQIASAPSPSASTAPQAPVATEQTVATNENPNTTETKAATVSGKWQSLKVSMPTADGQSEQTVEVPLVAADEKDVNSLLTKQQPLLSNVALEALESTGHEVKQHRAYYPVELEDGTQAVVPMDFVEVRNTSAWQ